MADPGLITEIRRRLGRIDIDSILDSGYVEQLISDGLAVLAHAAIQNSFGVSYLSPWGPTRVREMGDTILRRPIWLRRRPSTYHPLDEVRYKEADPGQDED